MIFDFQIPLEAVKKTNLGHIVMNFAQQPINISTYFMTFHRELYSKSFSNHFCQHKRYIWGTDITEIREQNLVLLYQMFPAILWLLRKTTIQGLNRIGQCPNGSEELMSAGKNIHFVYCRYITLQIACLFLISNVWFCWTRISMLSLILEFVNGWFFNYGNFCDQVPLLLFLIWKWI